MLLHLIFKQWPAVDCGWHAPSMEKQTGESWKLICELKEHKVMLCVCTAGLSELIVWILVLTVENRCREKTFLNHLILFYLFIVIYPLLQSHHHHFCGASLALLLFVVYSATSSSVPSGDDCLVTTQTERTATLIPLNDGPLKAENRLTVNLWKRCAKHKDKQQRKLCGDQS